MRAHLRYRAHQVIHQQVSEFVAPIIAALIVISCLIQIFSFYYLIRATDTTPEAFKILLTAIVVLACCITKIYLDFAMSYTHASNEFPNSFRECYGKLSQAQRKT